MAASITRIDSSARKLRWKAPVDTGPAPTVTGLASGLPSRIHLWRGASGHRYLCTVYSLLDCPPLPASVCLLVRREPDGRRAALDVRVIDNEHASLNLADVRRSGATLGANEVHVSFIASNAQDRVVLLGDLAGANVQPVALHA